MVIANRAKSLSVSTLLYVTLWMESLFFSVCVFYVFCLDIHMDVLRSLDRYVVLSLVVGEL